MCNTSVEQANQYLLLKYRGKLCH